jgi:ABC-type uncharacterized transport system involved in gliding motility auxiliary subunit
VSSRRASSVPWRPRLAAAATALLLVAAAVLLAWLSQRHGVETDWTRAGRHTLSDASVALLRRLEEPLEITAYAREDPALRALVTRFVGRYRRHRGDIRFAFVNPDVVPDEVRSLGIAVDGELVLRYRGRVEHVRTDSEQEFANALQRLLRPGERWIAFTEGHGERSAVGRANPDLAVWADQLRQRGFRFQPVNLGETQAIPDNTSVLVIAGPRLPFLPGELNIVRRFLDEGGNLLWLADPDQGVTLAPLDEMLGIRLPAGTVIDTASRLVGLDDPTIALVTASLYGPHAALDGFKLTTLLPTAGALEPRAGTGWSWTPLLSTGNHAWLEAGPLAGEVSMDAGTDRPGPLVLAAALTRPRPGGGEQRIAVVADGDFLSNTYVSSGANLELGLRLVNWLAGDEALITIPARTAGDTQLDMDPVLLGSLGVVFLLLLPLTLLGTGIAIWWRRSRL